MKKTTFPILALLLLGGSLYGQTVDVSQWPLQAERSRDYDAQHYRIRLNLDIAGQPFRGKQPSPFPTQRWL